MLVGEWRVQVPVADCGLLGVQHSRRAGLSSFSFWLGSIFSFSFSSWKSCIEMQ